MADYQLPRYQVFLQIKPGYPYQDVGSVHAADPEMALQNARDVFVRRPECNALWVIPAGAIYSRTSQELEEQGIGEKRNGEISNKKKERYYIFSKRKSAGTQTLVGEVEATSPAEALRFALKEYRAQKAFAWWIIPVRLITASTLDEADSMFSPAHDKPFRLSTEFHTLTAMRAIKKDVNNQ